MANLKLENLEFTLRGFKVKVLHCRKFVPRGWGGEISYNVTLQIGYGNRTWIQTVNSTSEDFRNIVEVFTTTLDHGFIDPSKGEK